MTCRSTRNNVHNGPAQTAADETQRASNLQKRFRGNVDRYSTQRKKTLPTPQTLEIKADARHSARTCARKTASARNEQGARSVKCPSGLAGIRSIYRKVLALTLLRDARKHTDIERSLQIQINRRERDSGEKSAAERRRLRDQDKTLGSVVRH